MTRRTIVDLGQVVYRVEEKPDGSVVLFRTTPVDDGPAQSVAIAPEALQAVAAEFWGMSIRRTMDHIAGIIAKAKAGPFGRDL